MRNVDRGCLLWLSIFVALSLANVAVAQSPVPTAAVTHLFDLTKAAGINLSLPSDVALGADGNIYIVDGGNHRLVGFDHHGNFLFAAGERGSGARQFEAPVGIGVGPRGRLFVADKDNHRIQILDSDGRFFSSIPLSIDNEPVRPVDVALDPSGTIMYVSGNNNHRVMALTGSGKLIRHWGGEGSADRELRYPATVVVGEDNRIYVVDILNTRVQVFVQSGRLSTTIGGWGVMPGRLFRPKGVALDNKNQVYVSDSYMGVIQVFDSETRFRHALGQQGEPHRFRTPAGIAVGPDQRLYVAEMLGNKIGVYALAE